MIPTPAWNAQPTTTSSLSVSLSDMRTLSMLEVVLGLYPAPHTIGDRINEATLVDLIFRDVAAAKGFWDAVALSSVSAAPREHTGRERAQMAGVLGHLEGTSSSLGLPGPAFQEFQELPRLLVAGVACAMSAPHSPMPPHNVSACSSNDESEDPNDVVQALTVGHRRPGDKYIDCANLTQAMAESATPTALGDLTVRQPARGGHLEHFPERLHRMLLDVERKGLIGVVSFLPHGRAFRVHDRDRFVQEVLPRFFSQSKWNSFLRQLSLYGFRRITSGPDQDSYYHELFLKNQPYLCRAMRRVGVHHEGQIDRRRCKRRPAFELSVAEPDFYSMKPAV
jgi:hypothetical protein